MSNLYNYFRNLFVQTQKVTCIGSGSKNRFGCIRDFIFSGKKRLQPLFFVLLTAVLIPWAGYGQPTNEAEWNGQGGYSLKKIVSNTSIQSGVNFSYTIMFSAPAGATSINIQDEIPPSLEVVSVTAAAAVNGVVPTTTVSGTPLVNEVVSYSLSGLPSGSSSSGSFTIVVKFPEGVTCDGVAARNRAGIRIGDRWHYTPYVSTTAIATDPWRVTKSIVSGAIVNPNGGSCGYLMGEGDTVTYRLSVLKQSPYYGNVTGQQNMNNAVVTDVLPPGAVFISSSCGVTPPLSGNTFTWQPNGGNLDATTPWAYYWCDITVHYPAGTFPNGTFINNEATLEGDMCNTQVSHTSNETCIEVANIVPNPNAFFQKYIYMTNRVPGCDGYYRIAFKNNGNVPLAAFDIDDAIPSGITVNSVRVFGGSATTTMSLTANSGVDPINSSITTNFYDSGPLSITVNDLQWQMTGSLPVGDWINLYVYFTVDANPPGTVVENCASFDGLANNLNLNDACVTFTVGEGEPKPCVLKEVCSPDDSYEPGDILRFRLRVQNIGSADITGATIQDMLHSNFSYVGNETYYVANNFNPSCSGGGALPSGATAWSGVTSNHSGNNLSWSLPDIASDCQLFYVGFCGYYGTWTLPYHFIEFDVMVDSLAMPGVTPNNYEISGGNLVSAVTSNTANVLVVASFGQEVEKQVSSDNGNNFASSATVGAGGTARFRLNYKNTSNVPVTSVSLVDLLAMNDGTDDWLVLDRNTSRGSQFGVTYVNSGTHSTSLSPSGTAPSASLSYAAGQNICLPDFGLNAGCTTSSWAGGSSGQNIRMDYGTFALAPGLNLREDFDVTVPANATLQETSCNDFAAVSTASFLLNGTAQSVALTPIAAPPVCLTADSLQASSCCDSLRLEHIYEDAAGQSVCCVRLTAGCEVDSVVVNITNGTFSSVNWNCGNLPGDYVGESSYTFDAAQCAVDMTTCVEPDSTGSVSVSYTVYYTNGEVCEEKMQMDCHVSEPTCCENVMVDIYQDPDLGECCAQFVSECETDSVVVSIHNGTFSAATLNGTSLSSGFAGQSSFTFDTNSTTADLVTCVTPDSTGVVYISYVSYFANGEKCEKRVEMDCKAPEPTCCENVMVDIYQDPDLGECCAQFVSECETDSVVVSIHNGTFSAATLNGTSLSSGFAGQSSFTFDTNSTTADLVTCVTPDSTGVVYISYVSYFANGEKCEKRVEMDCKAPEPTCCENVMVDIYQDPDLGECCAQFVSECETDSVVVSIHNGTFSAATLNGTSLSSGFAGQSSFTFDTNSTTADLVTCVTPDSTGVVYISYVSYFANGEKCEKRIEMDCKAPEPTCCENVMVDIYQDPDLGECCAQFVSECETDSVVVSIHNGTFSAATLNGTSLSSGFAGQSSFTFDTNSTTADLVTCVTPDSTGVVYISYVSYFANGEKCEKRVEMDCKAPEPPASDCCPVVDFKLQRSWPFFNKYTGTFEILNPDPSNPICSVEISSSPAGNFTTGSLIIDGTASGQSWTSTSIPASGSLSPQAENEMLFSLSAFNYKGKITICITKCDGTVCCYEFNWNGNPIVVSPWEPAQLGVESKLVAVSVNPEMTEPLEERIKYVSFGFANEEDLDSGAEFFAIGGAGDCDDTGPDPTPGIIDPLDPDDDGDGIPTLYSYMSRHSAFFELTCPYRPGSGNAPRFNLVLKGGLPKLGMALISEAGNVIFDGEIDLANPDSVISSVITPGEVSGKMFEFINLYPNPSNGSFRVTYATGDQQDVEIRLVNPMGQTIRVLRTEENWPGVHNMEIDARDLAGGMYRVVLYSEGEVRSKSVVIGR